MPRSIAREQDVLKLPAPKRPPSRTSRRIGIHTSIAGGVENAAERAYRIGCSAFQIFSTSPRQWQPYELARPACDQMNTLRQKYDLKPLVIHTNYLINMASINDHFLAKSIEAFRGEVERALNLCAEYLVLHPGSFRGASRDDGLTRVAASVAVACRGLDLAKGGLTILIENTAGAEFSLGGSFEQVADVLQLMRHVVPIGACIDTCHVHVSGYDIVTEAGFMETLRELDSTVGYDSGLILVLYSQLDRHQHIGRGTIGLEPFRRLLNQPRFAHAAFIAETPIDEPGDDRKNVETLKSLVVEKKLTRRQRN